MSEPIKIFTPIIVPGAEPRVVKMFRESIVTHSKVIATAEALLERLDSDDSIGKRPTAEELDVIATALSELTSDREDAIKTLEIGIAELVCGGCGESATSCVCTED